MAALDRLQRREAFVSPDLMMDQGLSFDENPTWTIPPAQVTKMTPGLPAIGARKNEKAFASPTSLVMMDDLPIYEYPTWIIPAVRDTRSFARAQDDRARTGTRHSPYWDDSIGQDDRARAQDNRARAGTINRPGRESGAGMQDYVAQIRGLIKSSGVYALSSLASPLITLVLSPFLTHALSRSDYGALAILNTFVVLMAGVTQLGLNAAFFRAYGYDYESEQDRLDVLATFFTMLLLVSLPSAIIMVVTAPSLALFLLNAPALSDAVRVCAVVVLLQNLTLPGLFWLRAQARTMLYSIISILNLLVSAGATIYFVGVMQMGIDGALLAAGVGYALIVLTTLPVVLLRAGIRLRLDIARSMLVFGLPHMLNLIAAWVLQLLDRYLLGLLGSLSQTASYSVAYSLGGALVALLITPFSMAWWVVMYSIAKRRDALSIFRLIFRWFSMALLFAAFGLSTFGVIVLDRFFPPSYAAAAPVIPAVALSMVFYGANIVFSVGISLTRKTWLLTIAVGSSAILNTALNFLLIPYYGAMGAAMATLIAYVALAIISYIVNRWVYPVPFEIGLISLALLLGVGLYLGSNLLAQSQALYAGWAIHLAGCAVYGACLVWAGTRHSPYRKLPDRHHAPKIEMRASNGVSAPAFQVSRLG